MTKEQMLIAAVVSLFSMLAAYLRVIDARQEKKLRECEDDRDKLWNTLIDAGISVRRRFSNKKKDL